MATRTIVTSQPDVACDVCERRLLRGEQSEVFLAAGRPRTVCELCAPRAAHQGWQREADLQALSPAPLRAGRGRNLFERLRQVGKPPVTSPEIGVAYDREPEPYDFLGGAAAAGDRSETGQSSLPLEGPAGPGPHGSEVGELADGGLDPLLPAAPGDGPLQHAIEVFNAGEYPRRVASLTRSLGAPEVTVRPGEAVASAVVIVVAWELCWYSYEVDLGDAQGVETSALAQGTQLSELGREDRLANAFADARGGLTLTGPVA
jgi:hypothetical protein